MFLLRVRARQRRRRRRATKRHFEGIITRLLTSAFADVPGGVRRCWEEGREHLHLLYKGFYSRRSQGRGSYAEFASRLVIFVLLLDSVACDNLAERTDSRELPLWLFLKLSIFFLYVLNTLFIIIILFNACPGLRAT